MVYLSSQPISIDQVYHDNCGVNLLTKSQLENQPLSFDNINMGREHPHSSSFKKSSINFVLNTPEASMDMASVKQNLPTVHDSIHLQPSSNKLNQLAHIASLYEKGMQSDSSSNSASTTSMLRNSPHSGSTMQTSRMVEDTPRRPAKRIRKRVNVACEECGRVFGDSSSLKKHIRVVHRKVKDFPCDACGKTFAEKSNRSKHIIAAHLNQRSHPCDMCDKVFNFTDGLKRHKNNVHLGIRPYQCQDCKRWYKQKTHLLKHRQSVHGVPLPPPTRGSK